MLTQVGVPMFVDREVERVTLQYPGTPTPWVDRPLETLQAKEAAADLLVEPIRATAAQYPLRVATGKAPGGGIRCLGPHRYGP